MMKKPAIEYNKNIETSVQTIIRGIFFVNSFIPQSLIVNMRAVSVTNLSKLRNYARDLDFMI
jgi:hypothetical protein